MLNDSIYKELPKIIAQAISEIDTAENMEYLEQLRISYLGKKGRLTEKLRQLGSLSATEIPQAGQAINSAKATIQQHIHDRREVLNEERIRAKLAKETVDVTLPGHIETSGTLHLVTQTLQRIEKLFSQIGFEVAEGPEIEDDFHNFGALNIPEYHPARTMHDTFYFHDKTLLRTHTSSVQIRFMKVHNPPVRFIAPGRVYRCDSDTTHTPMFHQVEGLMIDENINFSHLKGLLVEFLECFFERLLDIRFRPSYFPFTEPSAEVDIWHKEGFLEVLGCGMVHPQVLKNMNVDSEKYTGFAFGMGVERLAMLRHEIDDIRIFFENDLRFLTQFK
ncbi:Phenylalanyl-tRNA synthetase alpha chain [uncultured Candidatus Thioglobus sp.]|nr:Phenylalanyl-tRNA synthetase alpha chain [uncultured Candidatus Thioglobus sp.]